MSAAGFSCLGLGGQIGTPGTAVRLAHPCTAISATAAQDAGAADDAVVGWLSALQLPAASYPNRPADALQTRARPRSKARTCLSSGVLLAEHPGKLACCRGLPEATEVGRQRDQVAT